MNADNIKYFYNVLGPDGLACLGHRINADECGDVQQEPLARALHGAGHVVVLGAGYGREAKYLHHKYPNQMLTLLDKSPPMVERLQELCGEYAEVVQGSVVDFSMLARPDMGISMWSGFADFSDQEQLRVMDNLHKVLAPHGLLFVDTTDVERVLATGGVGKIGDFRNGQRHQVSIDHPIYGRYTGQFPPEDQMVGLAESAGFAPSKVLRYNWNGSQRIQYEFENYHGPQRFYSYN